MADCTALFHSFFLSTELFSILKALCAKSIEVARQACALPCATPSYASMAKCEHCSPKWVVPSPLGCHSDPRTQH